MSFLKKYKPTKLADVVVSDPAVSKQLKRWTVTKSTDPLLLYGSFGTGKSSIARTLPWAMYQDFDKFDLNWVIADGRNNIAERINNISSFCGTNSLNFGQNRFVILDEVDNLPKTLQASLKGHIDEHQDEVHFIMTTNYLHKVDGGLANRCRKLNIEQRSNQAWLPRMKEIMANEGYGGVVSDDELLSIARHSCGNGRDLLRNLETVVTELAAP